MRHAQKHLGVSIPKHAICVVLHGNKSIAVELQLSGSDRRCLLARLTLTVLMFSQSPKSLATAGGLCSSHFLINLLLRHTAEVQPLCGAQAP